VENSHVLSRLIGGDEGQNGAARKPFTGSAATKGSAAKRMFNHTVSSHKQRDPSTLATSNDDWFGDGGWQKSR
jgi:hypothetical protein